MRRLKQFIPLLQQGEFSVAMIVVDVIRTQSVQKKDGVTA